MIARILYRNNVQGVMNYVLGKADSSILGFQNTYSDTHTNTAFFGRVLYYLGNRHDSERRYVHATINLPRGEHLEDIDFFELSKAYMEHMGYGEQPYMVVRHHDTKHEHVHIVSTTIREDCLQINLSNDFKRNLATQKYLEKQFGLSPSPETIKDRELPIYRIPQFKNEDINGVRFYIQDITNNMLQKYKVRSFKELSEILRPHHIHLRTVDYNGRDGVSFGVDVENGYSSRFINGSTVHPQLSGPKLQKVFERNMRSKLFPMVKKRLEKQIMTTFKLFKSIHFEDLPDVLKSYQNLDCELIYEKKSQLSDVIIYDKSGFICSTSEIGSEKDVVNHPQIINSEDGETSIDVDSNQFVLEIQKLIKNAFYKAYLDANKRDILLSEFVSIKSFKEVRPFLASLVRYSFLNHYMPENNGSSLLISVQKEFESTRTGLGISEANKELKTLENRVLILKMTLEANVFDISGNKGILFHLLQSLGLKYGNGRISYINSNIHSVEIFLDNYHIPNENEAYISFGCIDQNSRILQQLMEEKGGKATDLNATAFFLPMFLPQLYSSMTPDYRRQFEVHSLKAYLHKTERLHWHYEKSAIDYIKLFNAKGFNFKLIGNDISITSIYSKHGVSIPLALKTQAYLKSIKNLDQVLNEQSKTLSNIMDEGRGQLKNLWLSYLIEKELYGKVAFMMIYDKLRPNLDKDVMEYHLEKGWREWLLQVSKQKLNSQQATMLRRSAFAFNSLLGGSHYKEEEVFNGFKDELTDYSKRNGIYLS
ncbi:relaxase/mobilization nuclease domain-containing protein [Arenibacter sp. BSSL-BM3]|uniref:Relaxase/mobilization nuclease domain-containing protein n=1 Tax=Arenibacter arenosicollis TaxID=2762274 RepID=A0ABR7QQF0_9FLAO|nr:relaxase/mobilization nuclease domain-containing protein [Arenibacter arenosicollis]MBC8769406.1 relaxase/mobilization nuclease domain-containing protein [Arenibacter arenosicollis]